MLFDYFDSKDSAAAHAKKHGGKVFVNTGKGATKVKGKPVNTHVVIKKEAVEYPHMMYDPKTGNEVKAKTPADHNKYAKMGYTHEKPKVDEASMSPMNLKRAEKFMGPSKNFNQAVNLVSKGMKVSKQQAIKMVKKILGVNPKTNKIESVNEVSKAESDKVNAKISRVLGKINFTHVYDKKGGMFKLPRGVKHELTIKKNDLRNATSLIKKDTGEIGSMYKKGEIKLVPFGESVDEALNLQQRMKRSRLMKRLKTRIKIGRDRARRKMANKKTLEKRAMRQARAAIAKKLTRGIPKAELTFARKQEIEKRLDKPALKNRIKRIAKRIFKDVRKKEVQRKKG